MWEMNSPLRMWGTLERSCSWRLFAVSKGALSREAASCAVSIALGSSLEMKTAGAYSRSASASATQLSRPLSESFHCSGGVPGITSGDACLIRMSFLTCPWAPSTWRSVVVMGRADGGVEIGDEALDDIARGCRDADALHENIDRAAVEIDAIRARQRAGAFIMGRALAQRREGKDRLAAIGKFERVGEHECRVVAELDADGRAVVPVQ